MTDRQPEPTTDAEWEAVRMEPDPIAALTRDPQTPATEAGRRLDELLISDYREETIAIEAEARERLAGLREAATLVDDGWYGLPSGGDVAMRYASDLPQRLNTLRAVLALLQPDTASEYGRLLAERDRLIADGADPDDLEMPERPQ